MFSKHSKPFFLLVIIFMISCCISAIDGSDLCKQKSVENVKKSENSMMATEYVFMSMEISSVMKCMELCLRFELCKSISSSKTEKFCNLNVRTDSEAPNAMKERNGTIFINRADIPWVLATGCESNSCGNESACMGNERGDPLCVPLFYGLRCSAPPVIDYATMEIDYPLMVGSTVHYFCDKGYSGSGDNMITCMENMTWSSSTFQYYRPCNNTSYVLHGDTCYAFKSTLKTWDEANLNCRNDGADLVSIETQEEFEWIINKIDMLYGGDVVSLKTFRSNWTSPVNLAPYGITFVDRKWFSFYVKGFSDTHEYLLVSNNTNERHYVVSIGTYNNGRVTIADVLPGGQTYYSTYIIKKKLLNSYEFRPFWISYDNGHIVVGAGLKFGYQKLLEWTSPSPLDIKYMAITGWKNYELQWQVTSGRHYWTSGNFDPSSGRDDYVWGTGGNAAAIDNGFTNWDPESTRATTDRRCVSLNTQWNKGGKWSDEICSHKYFYICEKEKQIVI